MSDSSWSEDEAAAGGSLEELFASDSEEDAAPPEPAQQEDDDGHLTAAGLVRTTPLFAEPAPASASVEPDGRVTADGILYRELRRPFTGTLWDALRNAFVRIDVDNRRLPTGGRPQGYIWATSGYLRSAASAARSRRRFSTSSAWRNSSAILNSLGALARHRSSSARTCRTLPSWRSLGT